MPSWFGKKRVHPEEAKAPVQSPFKGLPRLLVSELKSATLHLVIGGKIKKLEQAFDGLESQDNNISDHLMCFWLAVHSEVFPAAVFLYEREPRIPEMLNKALEEERIKSKNKVVPVKGHSDPKPKITNDREGESKSKAQSPTDMKKKSSNMLKYIIGNSSSSRDMNSKEGLMKAPIEMIKRADEDDKIANYKYIPTSNNDADEFDIDEIEIPDAERDLQSSNEHSPRSEPDDTCTEIRLNSKNDLTDLKARLLTGFEGFNSLVLRVAVAKGEGVLAGVIAVHYTARVTDTLVRRAIEFNTLEFLKALWEGEKNLVVISGDAAPSWVSYEWLFKEIMVWAKDDANAKIREVAKWKLEVKENVLASLLKVGQEEIACDNVGAYFYNVDVDLLLLGMRQDREVFMKFCLMTEAFTKHSLADEIVSGEIIKLFRFGQKTTFLLNIIGFVDFTLWNEPRLIEIMDELARDHYEKNRLLLAPNPVMAVTLCAEYLIRISLNLPKLKLKCEGTRNDLLKLSSKIIEKIEDDDFLETLFLERDFFDRNMIDIIIKNKFTELLKDAKVGNLLEKMWYGPEAKACDGYTSDFSTLSYLYIKNKRKISGRDISFKDVFSTDNFKCNRALNYSFQYRFRRNSISFISQKEILCALVILVIFQYINLEYVNLFKFRAFEGLTSAQQLVSAQEKIDTYSSLIKFGTVFSGGLLMSGILKLCYNLFTPHRIHFDKWTMIDAFTAITNLLASLMISNTTPEQMLDLDRKRSVDYFMIAVLIFSWLRFFAYFYIIKSVSPLLLTLVELLARSLFLVVIVCSYLLIVTSIMNTLFIDVNESTFGTMGSTFEFLYNAMYSTFSYDGMEDYTLTFTILIMIHVTFAAVIMYAFYTVISISIFDSMQHYGDYLHKANVYQYSLKYRTAFNEETYRELVCHPSPLCLFSVILLPLVAKKELMLKWSRKFSKAMFWMENFVYLVAFFLYEAFLLAPAVYLKQAFNIMRSSSLQFKKRAKYVFIGYLFLGPFHLFGVACKDTSALVSLLADHENQDYGDEEEMYFRIDLYTEVLRTMKALYAQARQAYKIRKEVRASSVMSKFTNEGEDIELDEEDEAMKEEFVFSVHKNAILAHWKREHSKNAAQQEEERRRLKAEQENENFVANRDLAEENALFEAELADQVKPKPEKEEESPTVKRKLPKKGLSLKRKKPQKEEKERLSPQHEVNKSGIPLLKDKASTSFFNFSKTITPAQNFAKNFTAAISTSSKDDSKPLINSGLKFFKTSVLAKAMSVNMSPKKGDKDARDSVVKSKGSVKTKLKLEKFIDKELLRDAHLPDSAVSQKEIDTVSRLLDRFTTVSENTRSDHIDLYFALKALPDKLDINSLMKVERFDFTLIQQSLIAFQNTELNEMFDYYDEIARRRAIKINEKMLTQRETVEALSGKMGRIHALALSKSKNRKKVSKPRGRLEARREQLNDSLMEFRGSDTIKFS